MLSRRSVVKAGILTPLSPAAYQAPKTSPVNDPIDALTCMVGSVLPIPDTEFERRFQLLWELRHNHEVDAFFTESGSTLQYFTEAYWGRSEMVFGAVIPIGKQPIFICPAFEVERAQEQV